MFFIFRQNRLFTQDASQGICQNMGLFGHGVKCNSGGCAQFAVVNRNAVYALKYFGFFIILIITPHLPYNNTQFLELIYQRDSPAYLSHLEYHITQLKKSVRLVPIFDSSKQAPSLKLASLAGEDVLVIGCGPIGLFAIAIAKYMGAAKGKFVSLLCLLELILQSHANQ